VAKDLKLRAHRFTIDPSASDSHTDNVQTPVVSAAGKRNELLERDRELETLADSLAAVRDSSRGRLTLVGGEAGVGKTALVRKLCDERRGTARMLWGACDALFTPRPLGPLIDLARMTGGDLEELVKSDVRPHEVAAALMDDLRAHAVTIVVIEDVHWADEATLDVLRILGRRVDTVPALVVATYRDDQLDHASRLRIVLGELTGEPVGRLSLAPLSPSAVARLAEPHGVDADELYRATAGNPFFVTEALAAGEEEIPQTIRDAVLARAARLSDAARGLVEAVAVVPPQAELWLLNILVGDAVERLEECLASGMLSPEPQGVAFRHELARLAIEESIAPNRRVELNKQVLSALPEAPSGASDPARLAHHAEAAGDTEAVLRYAPAAAERAASLGAHRESAAQYARALRFAEGVPLARLAELLERRSFECYLTDQSDEAVEALERALECWRELGDVHKEGAALSRLSRRVWCAGENTRGERLACDAVVLLEGLPPSPELGRAYSMVSSYRMNLEDAEGALPWGARALELAERFDDRETSIDVLNTIGTMEALRGVPQGWEKLERSLGLALEAGLEESVGRAFIHMAWVFMRTRQYELEHRIEVGMEHCKERGLDLWWLYLLAYRARADIDRGRWDAAADAARFVLRYPRSAILLRILALAVLGLVRARRGDPDHRSPLDESLALAELAPDLQHLAPVAVARAEVAWLEGDLESVARETDAVLELAVRREASWVIGEVVYWRWQAGIREEIPPGAAEPYALQIRGDWERAAEAWARIGCPYEAALALADADDDDTLRRALDDLQGLGAQPAATIVARRLRERGARGIPRGPRPATRANPANLTSREVEVLELVAEGLRNGEIANRLFLAEKTVDHHVSAILRKLDVRTRAQASADAVRLGLVAQDR
jgi:DNA-binding CsgD family transcriptional regulator/tetratricopeptide (TPR) repeat protein